LNSLSTDNLLRKVTISMAIAQSVKLAWFERQVDDCIDSTTHIPHTLAIQGFIKMTRQECLQAIGKLFHVVCYLYGCLTQTVSMIMNDHHSPRFKAHRLDFEQQRHGHPRMVLE
jgi:hypothetical protein